MWISSSTPGNPRFPIDEEAVARKAAETGVALEVNNSSLTVVRLGSEEICLRLITKSLKSSAAL